MQIKGTITRAYREGDRTFVHVRPSDPEELRYIDGSKRLGDGTIRQEVTDDAPDDDEELAKSVGKETEVEVESAKDDEEEPPRRPATRRRSSSPPPTE